jgi:2-polyprenyl-6-methoxyphenol hydroxylase-like FAD-dependent oxidoreductase
VVDDTADVAIVGYGPVGQLLAILLGQRGYQVRVFERWPGPYPLPRAVHLDHEVARILQGAGVIETLLPHTEAASIYEWRNAAGEVLIRLGRDVERSLSGWPESLMFCQPELERVLCERARSLPSVKVEWGCEVVSVRDAGDHVELRARQGDDGTRSVRARFAVGCDGANSFVRGVIGSGWHDLGFEFDWLVVDVIPHELRTWDPINWQLCDPARPTTLVSGGPGRRRWEFMRLPHETLEELNSEAAAWRLLDPWEMRPDNARLERHAVYTFRGAWADTWRKGRLLVAGDAAHLTPPFAGQGMCSGMRDAANLAWKLDLVLAGRAAEALLDTYPSERVPHVRALIDLAVALGRVICVPDPAEAAARDRRMIAEQRERKEAVSTELPALGPGCFADGGAAARRLFVQDRVRRGGAAGLFDDVVGRGFALVSPHGDPARTLGSELAAFFESIGGITAHVAPGGPVTDLGGGYARWFGEQGAAVALQRPDFAVFGTAATLDDAAGLVATLRAKLEERAAN